MIQVNLVAVVIAAVAAMAVGFVWYSKSLFGKQWMEASGMSESSMKGKGMGKTFAIVFVATLIMGYILSIFIHYAGAYSLMNGAKTGVWAWVGFVMPTTLANHLFSSTNKSMKLYVLAAGHHLVALMVMGAILASWY